MACIFRGVLRISDKAQRCLCNVESTAVRLCLAYDLSSEYSQLSHIEALHHDKEYSYINIIVM